MNSKRSLPLVLGRGRSILAASLGALGVKAVTTLATILSVPIALHHLGDERYGVWMDLSGIVFIVSMADFGLANRLVNHVIVARAKDDVAEIVRRVSNTFFTLVITSLVLMVLAVLLVPAIPWSRLIRLQADTSITEVVPALMILCCGTLMMLPLEVYNRVQLAYDEPLRASAWAGLYNVTQLLGVFIASRFTRGLPALVGLYVLFPLLLHLVSAGWEIAVRKPWLRPRLAVGNLKLVWELIGQGRLFFLYQIAFAVTTWSDYTIVGNLLGADANARYGVAFRLFSAGLLASYAGRGVWLAFMSAIAQGDYTWARRAFQRLCILNAFFGFIVAGVLFLASPMLIRLWIGRDIGVSEPLRLAFGAWLFVFNFVEMLTGISLGTNTLRVHTYLYAASAVAALVLRIWLTRNLGLVGIVWGAVLAYSLLYVLPTSVWLYRHLATLRDQPNA